jgi:hypothetical protein
VVSGMKRWLTKKDVAREGKKLSAIKNRRLQFL